MKQIKILKIMTVLCILTGCTVLEDRTECPCHMVLDFSATDTTLISSVHIRISDDFGDGYKDSLSAKMFMPEYAISVSRSEKYVNIYSGRDLLIEDEGGITVPPGCECPSVYMHSAIVDASFEELHHSVQMHKNHCVMNIIMENESSTEYELCVRGNICGYGRDGSPAEGEFRFVPQVYGNGQYKVVLPRQKDTSLMIEIDDGTEVLKKFALGEFIAAGGYDWTTPDLEDITVYIDWTVTSISLTIRGWNWEYEHEIVI